MSKKLCFEKLRSRMLGWASLACLLACLLAISLPAEAQTATLLSQGRPVVASSTEAAFAAANAVDGNAGTRWGSAFTNNEWLYVDLGSTASINRVLLTWEAAFASGYQIQVSNNATSWTTIFSTTTGNGAIDDLTLSASGRYVRMLGTARATQWGYSLFEFQVFGTVGGGGGTATLLSQWRPAVASSAEGTFVAANAVDGNSGTRWGSAFTNNEWIYVDLGSTASISRVLLNWEAAFGSGYQIQVSSNATSWTTIFTTSTGNGATDDLTVSASGRYVRLLGTARATQWGYSLFEFQVFGTAGGGGGTCATLPGAPTSLSAAGVSSTSVTLSWTAPNPGANCTIASYRVFRGGVQVATPTGTSAAIGGLAANTTYSFTVAAVNAFGAGPQSGSLSVTTGVTTGDEPAGFWDTSNIPVAQNALMFKFLNRTNGRYPDSQLYWAFTLNGVTTVRSFAQAPTFDMPANSAGRMYFYIVTDPTDPVVAADPTRSPYYDFIEFTIGGNPVVFNGNTTRVDAFGLKLALRLNAPSGQDTVGEDYATFFETREATFAKFIAETPPEFAHLAQPPFAPFRIVEPGAGNFRQGGSLQTYMDSWVNELWANNGLTVPKPTYFCNPIAQPDLSAACFRHVGLGHFNPNGTLRAGSTLWSSSAGFYATAPAHYYARFWHTHSIGGKAYGFPYDDVGGYSSFISRPSPRYLLVALGW